MTNKEAIEKLGYIKNQYHVMLNFTDYDDVFDIAIKALEKDKCSSCKHYDKDYGETCLNPEGTCRVFEYDGYEEEENVSE